FPCQPPAAPFLTNTNRSEWLRVFAQSISPAQPLSNVYSVGSTIGYTRESTASSEPNDASRPAECWQE
ncbi:unnamed protein product, partial [Urochloa humidicola]